MTRNVLDLQLTCDNRPDETLSIADYSAVERALKRLGYGNVALRQVVFRQGLKSGDIKLNATPLPPSYLAHLARYNIDRLSELYFEREQNHSIFDNRRVAIDNAAHWFIEMGLDLRTFPVVEDLIEAVRATIWTEIVQIKSLPLAQRTIGLLERSRIYTLDQLKAMTRSELEDIKGLGVVAITRIEIMLDSMKQSDTVSKR